MKNLSNKGMQSSGVMRNVTLNLII